MVWIILWFQKQAEVWRHWADCVDASTGLASYAYWQASMWHKLKHLALVHFHKVHKDLSGVFGYSSIKGLWSCLVYICSKVKLWLLTSPPALQGTQIRPAKLCHCMNSCRCLRIQTHCQSNEGTIDGVPLSSQRFGLPSGLWGFAWSSLVKTPLAPHQNPACSNRPWWLMTLLIHKVAQRQIHNVQIVIPRCEMAKNSTAPDSVRYHGVSHLYKYMDLQNPGCHWPSNTKCEDRHPWPTNPWYLC